MARRSTADKFQEYEQLKSAAHSKVEELTVKQLRKFLAAYRNPGGWNTEQVEPQVAAMEKQL
jgi:hypothetical protein